MSPVLLDTHVLIWSVADAAKLGKKTRRLIGQAVEDRSAWVSAISFWEVALLVLRKAIEIDMTLDQWRLNALAAGIRELPLSGDAAIRGAQALPYHTDPSDCMIVGAALVAGATLITADYQMLAWAGRLPRQDARR